ncbi:ATP-binding protein (plasmid) [Metabacillus halosaccharovorans]|uniref:ATP-binding protein n=1 Tax=Metabacillus halosaccharovorans TaxID=930124 RepID=UPI001C1F5977|nr:hypothetical protein [Metabacillus halosaccharovorans]
MNKNQLKWTFNFGVLIFILLIGYSSFFAAKSPYIGNTIEINNDNTIEVIEVEPGGQGDKLGIEVGDIILEVDGKDPLESEIVTKYQRIEQADSIKVQKPNGKTQLFELENSLDIHMVFHVIVPFAIAILALYAIFHIYKTNSESVSKSSLILMLFLFCLSLAYSSAGGSSRGDIFLRLVNVITFLNVPVLFIHFMYHYFSEIGKVWFSKYVYRVGYSLTLLSFLFDPFLTVSVKKTTNLLTFVILYLVVVLVMVIGLKIVEYRAQKYLIKVLFISNIVGITPFIIFYGVPYALFEMYIFPPALLSGFVLIIPAAVVYQFLAEKIHDIDFFIGRMRYLLLIGLLPALINVIVVSTMESGLYPGFYQVRLYILFLFVIMLSFYYKEILDFRLNRFSEKRNYQSSIFNYTEKLRTANNVKHVIEELKKTILDITIVSDVELIEIDQKSNKITIDYIDNNTYKLYEEEIISCQEYIGQIIEINKGFIIFVGEATKRNYLLLCTSKINTPKLTRDELSYLKTLAYYTNVTLENFLKIENLMVHLENIEATKDNPIWLNRVLFKLEEKQRSEVAKDLHDSVLQDLLSFQKKLENTKGKYDKTSEYKHDTELMMDDINKIIYTTRETLYELRPNVLYDLGLKNGIQKLVDRLEENTNIDVHLNVSRLKNPEDIDVQLNIYRIIQELFNNATKHSSASTIALIVVNIKEQIVIHYEDDGIGANPNAIFNKDKSMGLSGVRERVALLNGKIDVETEINQGFKVIIEI